MSPLALAWKLVAFYDLTPHTLRRLTLRYGLEEGGGFTLSEASCVLLPALQQLGFAITSEEDPRARRCLVHQLTLTYQALALRSYGVRARVRGWLVSIEGGKASHYRTPAQDVSSSRR